MKRRTAHHVSTKGKKGLILLTVFMDLGVMRLPVARAKQQNKKLLAKGTDRDSRSGIFHRQHKGEKEELQINFVMAIKSNRRVAGSAAEKTCQYRVATIRTANRGGGGIEESKLSL